jgi:UDP-N-acetylglucosamine 1-carboxyvinyltransferase
MDIFEIDGPVQLSGAIDVAGSKNATLPILAAMLLAGGESVIANAPDLADIRSMEVLIESLGAKVWRDKAGLHIDAAYRCGRD